MWCGQGSCTTCAVAVAEAVAECARHPSCVRQGAGVEELLRAFDVVRAKHEGMDAGEYNADGTYKDAIIMVKALRPALRETPPV